MEAKVQVQDGDDEWTNAVLARMRLNCYHYSVIYKVYLVCVCVTNWLRDQKELRKFRKCV